MCSSPMSAPSIVNTNPTSFHQPQYHYQPHRPSQNNYQNHYYYSHHPQQQQPSPHSFSPLPFSQPSKCLNNESNNSNNSSSSCSAVKRRRTVVDCAASRAEDDHEDHAPLSKVLELLYVQPWITNWLLPPLDKRDCNCQQVQEDDVDKDTGNSARCQGQRWELITPELIELSQGMRIRMAIPRMDNEYGDDKDNSDHSDGLTIIDNRLLFVPVKQIDGFYAGWVHGELPFHNIECVGGISSITATHFVQDPRKGQLLALTWSRDASKLHVMWLQSQIPSSHAPRQIELLLLDGHDVLNAVASFQQQQQQEQLLYAEQAAFNINSPLIIKEFERISSCEHEHWQDTSSASSTSGCSASGHESGRNESNSRRKRRKKMIKPRRSALVPAPGEFQRFDQSCFNGEYQSTCTRSRGSGVEGKVEREKDTAVLSGTSLDCRHFQRTISGHLTTIKSAASVDLQELRIAGVAGLIENGVEMQRRQPWGKKRHQHHDPKPCKSEPEEMKQQLTSKISSPLDDSQRSLKKASIDYLIHTETCANSPNGVVDCSWYGNRHQVARTAKRTIAQDQMTPRTPSKTIYSSSTYEGTMFKNEGEYRRAREYLQQPSTCPKRVPETDLLPCWETRRKERSIQLQRLREYARRLRNRETARLSNERRKTKTMEMEAELNELRACMATMERKNRELEHSNRELLMKVKRLESDRGS